MRNVKEQDRTESTNRAPARINEQIACGHFAERGNIAHVCYIAIFMVICLLPFVGMLWAPASPPASQEEAQVALPELTVEDGSPNLYYFPQLGTYFEDHFAYRNLAVDADARIKTTLFATSPNEQVVVGNDGWLYYGGELSDYLGEAPLTEREANNIAHNLSLVQGYAEARDAEFVFTIAPNKSSLYPQHMPYYLPASSNEDMSLLKNSLDEKKVNYADMFELFESEQEELYRLTDSHWNSDGALLAANELMEEANKAAISAADTNAQNTEHIGDLEKMLYPNTAVAESITTYDVGNWSCSNEARSVEDAIIETSATGEGRLLMFRDSFGDALLPLVAPQFEQAIFSKIIPYDMTQLENEKPSVVIIERAQRHIDLLSTDPPIMFAPRATLTITGSEETASTINTSINGDFLIVEGIVDESAIGVDDEIFIEIVPKKSSAQEDGRSSTCYAPYHTSVANSNSAKTDYGYKAFLPANSYGAGEYSINLLVKKADSDDVFVVAAAFCARCCAGVGKLA